jgi:hypothetical protein
MVSQWKIPCVCQSAIYHMGLYSASLCQCSVFNIHVLLATQTSHYVPDDTLCMLRHLPTSCKDFASLFPFASSEALTASLRSFIQITMHGPLIRPYALAGVGVYGFDVLFRMIKTRLCTARLVPMPSLSMTRVEVLSLNSGWRAGQHVRLRVLSFHMGWFGWSESHPFTIASVAGDGGLVLLCKRAGDWTEKLYALSKHVGYGDEGAMERAVKVIIEGPYGSHSLGFVLHCSGVLFIHNHFHFAGGPGYTVFASYSAAVFVVGGSGITFALAALQELVQADLAGKSRVKIIELIWSVQDPCKSIYPFTISSSVDILYYTILSLSPSSLAIIQLPARAIPRPVPIRATDSDSLHTS